MKFDGHDVDRDIDKACRKKIDALGDDGADLVGGIEGASLDPESSLARPELQLPCLGELPKGLDAGRW